MNTETNSYQSSLKKLQTNLSAMLPEDALQVFNTDAHNLQVNHKIVLQLKVGDKAPDFSLLNATGKTVKLSELLTKSKIVLTFYRGSWCPYCNLQLAHYQNAITEIHSLGAELVAISAQIPDESLSIKEKNKLNFEVLSDSENDVAKKYTTVFKNADAPINTMTTLGYNFDAYYSNNSRELPIPAIFIIEQDATISFAKSLGGDYRNRVDASEIINSLKNN